MNNLSCSERLYQRGLQKKASLARLAKEKQQQREAQELQGLTFSPAINTDSKFLNKKRVQEKPEVRLISHIQHVHEKQAIIKSSVLAEHKAVCTFRPQINRKYTCLFTRP